MDQFEKAAKFKALGMRSAAGSWDQARALLDELGAGSWRRKSLMGASPEEAAFDFALASGDRPPSQWIASIGATAESATALEARAAESFQAGLGPDQGRAALAWLGELAGSRGPWPRAFESVGKFQGLDASGFCKAVSDSAARGELDAGWVDEPGFWALAGRAPLDFKKAMAAAITKSGLPLRRPFEAAKLGAPAVAIHWIEELPPESALALLAAAASSSEEHWEQFAALSPEAGSAAAKSLGVEGLGGLRSWGALAAHAAGLQWPEGLGALGLGERSGALGKPSYDEERIEGWRSALGALVRRAFAAMEMPGMEESKAWIGSALVVLDPQVAQLAAPRIFDEVSFDSAGASDVDDALEAAIAARSPRLGQIAAKAARRLAQLSPQVGKSRLGEGEARGGMSQVANRLWCAPDPSGFEAFISELGALSGSQDKALELCSFPWLPIGRGEGAPGSAGHVVALMRLSSPMALRKDGARVWQGERRDNLLGELWTQCVGQAAMGHIDAGGTFDSAWRLPPPESIGARSEWAGIALSDPKWGAGADAGAVAGAWESAFEAMAVFAGEAMDQPAMVLPSTAELAMPPWRRGFAAICLADPDGAALWAARQWLAGGEQAKAASRLCSGMQASAKEALAGGVARAFEVACSGWSSAHQPSSWKVAKACRDAASVLGADSDEPYSKRECICAAAMAGASFGIALALREGLVTDRGPMRSLLANGVELAAMMPEAASALGASPNAPLDSAALAGKALWGALAMSPFGSRFDSKAWEDVPVDPADPWVRSCLAAAFTKPALVQGAPWIAEDVARAGHWLGGLGACGHERSPLGRSALEWAVDCRIRDADQGRLHGDAGCFGEAAVNALVSLGADPSEAGAPRGEDAMALCVDMERRSSPSSIMKALCKSEKAAPWRGDSWRLIACGKSTLSDKLAEAIADKACSRACMDSFARLGTEASHGRAGAVFRAALREAPCAALAPALLGAMARMEPPASGVQCHCAAKALSDLGISPDEDSLEALFQAMLRSIARASGHEVQRSMSDWIASGARPSRFDPALCEPPDEGRRSEGGWIAAWIRFDLGPDCALGELLLAKAAGGDPKRPASLANSDARKFCEAALALPEEFQGAKFDLACAKFIESMQGPGFEERVGPDSGKLLACLEERSLRSLGSPGPQAPQGSKRM